jgi:hypothetical protein
MAIRKSPDIVINIFININQSDGTTQRYLISEIHNSQNIVPSNLKVEINPMGVHGGDQC